MIRRSRKLEVTHTTNLCQKLEAYSLSVVYKAKDSKENSQGKMIPRYMAQIVRQDKLKV